MPRHLSYSRRCPTAASDMPAALSLATPALAPVLPPLDYAQYQPAATPERLAARARPDPRVRRRRTRTTRTDIFQNDQHGTLQSSGSFDLTGDVDECRLPNENECDDADILVQVAFELDRRTKAMGEVNKLADELEYAQRCAKQEQRSAHEADLRVATARDVVANGGPTSAHFARSMHNRQSLQYSTADTKSNATSSIQQGVYDGTFQLGIDPAKARKLPSHDDRGKFGMLRRIRAIRNKPFSVVSTPGTPRSPSGTSQCSDSRKHVSLQYPTHGMPDVHMTKLGNDALPVMAPRSNSALRRQYSNGLRRFASAGGAFVKRVSSRSTVVSKSTLAVEVAAAACLDYDILVNLQNDPEQTLAQLQLEANQARKDQTDAEKALSLAETRLNKRKALDDRKLRILDRFYARLHGYESDPVAKKMLGEVADMSESAIQVERDLWYKYSESEVMQYALEDHSNGLTYVSEALTLLNAVVQELYTAKTTNYADLLRQGRSERLAATEAKTRLRAAKIGTGQALSKATLASACCPTIPRVKEIAVASSDMLSSADSSLDSIGFDNVMYKAIVDAFSATQTSVIDCHEAVAWCKSRVAQIERDITENARDLQTLEQDVLEERMALLRQHHEVLPDFFVSPPEKTKRTQSPSLARFAVQPSTSRKSV